MTKLAELQKFIEVEKQPSPGLVQRRVTVHPEGGQPFTRRQWVRPDEIEGENKRSNEEPEKPENFNSVLIREREGNINDYEGISAKDLDDSQRLISDSKVIKSSSLGGGVNVTEIIELENGKKAVFKPLRGEVTGETSSIKGPFYLKEVAAYKVSKILGFDYVPSTTVKYIENNVGSAQEFVENAKRLNLANLHPEIIEDCALFDQVIGNIDRHGGNALSKDGKPVLIDHGYSFPDDPNIKPWSIFVKQITNHESIKLSDKHIDLLTNFYKNKKEHAQKLRPYLRKREIAGIFVRINEMLENRSYFLTRKENE